MTILPKLNHGKPVWKINYSLLGKQKRKFFKRSPELGLNCPGRAQAEKFAEQWANSFGSARAKVSMKPVDFEVMFQIWQKIRELEMTTPEVMEILARQGGKRILLADAMDQFLKELRALEVSKWYQKTIKSTLKQFCDMFPGRRVDELMLCDIQRWRDEGQYRSASRRTRLNDIKTFYKHAVIARWTRENPCKGVKAPRVILGSPGILTPKQGAKLLRVAFRRDRAMCCWLALALFCGIRPKELSKITWENVRINQGLVEVSAAMSKTARRRIVSIPPNAVAWLRLTGQLPLRNTGKRFARLRRQAGLFENWPHDAMRHSAATYLYALTDDAKYVAKQMGHNVDTLLRNYNSLRTKNGLLVTKELAKGYFEIRPNC